MSEDLIKSLWNFSMSQNPLRSKQRSLQKIYKPSYIPREALPPKHRPKKKKTEQNKTLWWIFLISSPFLFPNRSIFPDFWTPIFPKSSIFNTFFTTSYILSLNPTSPLQITIPAFEPLDQNSTPHDLATWNCKRL